MLFLVNQKEFRPERYGAAKIEQQSVLLNKQFDTLKPSWLRTTIQQVELEDETDFLQFG